MLIVFRRTLRVRCHHLVATISSPVQRAVEQAIVAWADEQLESGRPPSAADLAVDAAGPLPGRPILLAERLLKLCAELQLLRLYGGFVQEITDLGRRAIASGSVFVPEHGAWTIWWAEDPVLPNPLLQLEPYDEPSAHEEVRARRDQQRRMEDAPRVLTDLEGKILRLPGGGLRELRLDEIGSRVEEVPEDSRVILVVEYPTDDAPRVRLEGRINKTDVALAVEQSLPPFETAWRAILEARGWSGNWIAERQRLGMLYEIVSAAGRRTFLETFKLSNVELASFGSFSEAQVTDVPVEPASDEDAGHWFRWLLADGVDDYQWPDMYDARCSEMLPRFHGHEILVPSQSDFAQGLRSRASASIPNPRYWLFQAPLDLDPAQFTGH